ncbi:MAG TPA: O-antigen ligase family protein [Terriglobia bacterium]|nr:O-antigen ligase family protein [Terriglobia bacterium]
MNRFRHMLALTRADLPASPLARWASILLTLSTLTFLISIAASEACLIAASLVYAFHLLRERPRIHFPPVKLPLALFCSLSVVSVFFAANPSAGWFVVRKLVLFLILLVVVNLVVTARHLEWLCKALCFEAALAGFVAIVQFVIQYQEVSALHPGRVYFYMTLTRIHGFMGHWMNFAGQQMLVFVTLAALILLSVRVTKLWWGVGAVVAVSLILSFTRGVWLGCLVALVYLVARSRPRWLWALPVLILVSYLAAPSLLRQRVHLALHPSADPALSIRLEMWQAGLRMIRKHPWLGVGPNNIEQEYVLYLAPGRSPEPGFHSHLHNDYLQIAAERGLPCLAALLWLLGALGWHIWKICQRAGEARWIAEGALAAWLAMLVEGFFEFNLGTSPVLMVFLFYVSTPFVLEKLRNGVGPRAGAPPLMGRS